MREASFLTVPNETIQQQYDFYYYYCHDFELEYGPPDWLGFYLSTVKLYGTIRKGHCLANSALELRAPLVSSGCKMWLVILPRKLWWNRRCWLEGIKAWK